MKIESYSVDMQASSSFVQKEQSLTSIRLFSRDDLKEAQNKENLNIKQPRLNNIKAVYNDEENLSFEDKIKKILIELLLEQLTKSKKEIKLYPHHSKMQQVYINPYTNQSSRPNWGFSFQSSQEYYQKSSVEFSTQATIKTNTGEFNININMSLTQEFYQRQSINISAGAPMQDPLLINYNSDIGSFDNISKNMSFEFDLNGDGENETIPELVNGTGYLALDKNNNGNIDNGNELFGPNTGDGFEELRAYDEDGNNWIDENDSIFSQLRIWEKDENGNNSLITLGQAGVGAIYLAGVKTDFNYANGYNDIKANMKEASFFLKENGEAGIVSSVDYAV